MEEEVKLQDLPVEVTVDVVPQQPVIQEVMQAEVQVQAPDNAAHRPIKTDLDRHRIAKVQPLKTGECSRLRHKAGNNSNKEIPDPMCTDRMRHVRACNKVELRLRRTAACMVEAWEAEAWVAVWAAAWAEEAWVAAAWAVVAVVVADADRNALF